MSYHGQENICTNNIFIVLMVVTLQKLIITLQPFFYFLIIHTDRQYMDYITF